MLTGGCGCVGERESEWGGEINQNLSEKEYVIKCYKAELFMFNQPYSHSISFVSPTNQ